MSYAANSNVRTAGFWFGLSAFAATVAYCVVQLWQVYGNLRYPLDEIPIYGTSLCIVIPFVLAVLAFHYTTPDEKKFWSHAAVLFSVIYAVFVTSNYVVQLTTVIPATLRGEADDVKLLAQTPHSLFWDFDALGYIFMALAMLVAIPALERVGFQRWVRYAFWANVLMTPCIGVVYFYPVYSERLLVLGYAWGITAPLAMLMLTLYFRKGSTTEEPQRSRRIHQNQNA